MFECKVAWRSHHQFVPTCFFPPITGPQLWAWQSLLVSANQSHVHNCEHGKAYIEVVTYQWCFLVFIPNLTLHSRHVSPSHHGGSFDNISANITIIIKWSSFSSASWCVVGYDPCFVRITTFTTTSENVTEEVQY